MTARGRTRKLRPGTVVKVHEHDGVARVVNHGRDSGGIWTGVEFDYDEFDDRKPRYEKFHRSALTPVRLHLVQLGRAFREAARTTDEREGREHRPIPMVTECGLTELGPNDAVMTRDHIAMWDDRPDQPRVTCKACLKAETEAADRVRSLIQTFKERAGME